MKKTFITNLGLALILTGGLTACGNESNTVAGDKDSARGDTVDRAALTPGPDSLTSSVNTPADSEMNNPDAGLVYQLVESMYGGIALMKDGETKATTPAVKQLAKKLYGTHTKLTEELKALATKKGWKFPAGESSTDMTTRTQMSTQDVSTYEKSWVVALAARHETNIGKIEAAKPMDPDLKAAGEKALPVLKGLLANIKSVEAGLK